MKPIIQNISKIISLTPEEEAIFLSKIENKNLIDLEKLTVSYYQTASERFKNGKMKQSN